MKRWTASRNGQHWRDNGLVFARGWDETPRSRHLGAPLQRCRINPDWVRPLCEVAEVKVIRFHGCRHTSATLLLKAGVAPHVVAHRIGHSTVRTTLEVYAHALPSQQKEAASKLAAIMQL